MAKPIKTLCVCVCVCVCGGGGGGGRGEESLGATLSGTCV